MWGRRDLRLADNPALLAARDAAGRGHVVAVFVLDPALWNPSGGRRRSFLTGCLNQLNEAMDGNLVVRRGDPTAVLPQLAAERGAGSVHIAADTGPYGRRRDEAVERALGEVDLIRTGSAYAVTPGRVTKPDGRPNRVFTPYSRAWRAHGWRAPASTPAPISWLSELPSERLPAAARRDGLRLPAGGEAAARTAWRRFLVDAGMRQLLAEGWMHNRVRMLVASFLVKDLHQEWTRGARWFM